MTEERDERDERDRLREALTYYAEGRYPDGGEIARGALAVSDDEPRCTDLKSADA